MGNNKGGFLNFSMTLAIVNVLPEPVTPKRVCSFTLLFIPSTNELMAFGWSPNGW